MGVVQTLGILNVLMFYCVSRVGMALLCGCLMIITGFEVNLGTSERNKNDIYQYKLNLSKTCGLSYEIGRASCRERV